MHTYMGVMDQVERRILDLELVPIALITRRVILSATIFGRYSRLNLLQRSRADSV